MATNRITVDASPEDVFDVLSDAHSYAGWVVGASEVRGADASWPDARASFSHTQGVPALGLRDSTTVIETLRRLKRWSEYTARRRLQKAPKRQTARSRGRAS